MHLEGEKKNEAKREIDYERVSQIFKQLFLSDICYHKKLWKDFGSNTDFYSVRQFYAHSGS